MDYTGLHKKTLIHTLLIALILLLMPATALAVPQQQNDIKKPTRERVKSNDKKAANDKKSSSDNKKDNKADAGKKDNKPAEKPATTPAKQGNKPAADDKKDDKKAATTNEKKEEKTDDKSAAAQPAAPKPAPVDPNYNGIDVSKHQGTIKWETVKKDSKIQYVYIKATEGSDLVDEQYAKNLANARKAGLKVGSYHYLTNKSSVTNQFKNFAQNAPRDEQDLIPVIDVEVCRQWTSQQLRDSLKVFANMVEDYYGCKPIIYTYESFFKKHLGLAFSDYPIFIAKYSRTAAEVPNINGVKWILWQYSESGRVNGITGNVDLSRFNKGHSINDILYRPAKGKPRVSVKDAVDRNKPKPTTVNLMEQPSQTNKKDSEKEKEDKKKAEKAQKEKELKEKQAQSNKAKEDKAKAEREKAQKAKEDRAKAQKAKAEKEKVEKEKAEKAKADKVKADKEKAEKAKADKARAEQEAKEKRKAEAKKARQAQEANKAKKSKSSKAAGMMHSSSDMSKSQRNDSIRSAQYKGRKINKSSADND